MLVSIRPASAEAAMSSAQYLREFIKERLTAVCEEIFSEVQKTIVQYEEEINRQHRLLDISRKPDRNSHIIVPEDLPQLHDCVENESVDEQQVCNQEMNSSLIFFQIKEEQEDPEPPQIKEEQEELCSSQEGEQLGLKQEADTFMVTLTYEQSDHSEPEPNSEQYLPLSSPEAELKKRTDHGKSLDDTLVSDSQSKTHTRKNSVQCNTCGKMFPYRSHLITHLRVHTGEKLYSCTVCGKRFGQKSDLERHVRIHTGEKPYSCAICGKKFREKSGMERHVRIHTGEKPHCCSICGKRFIQMIQLKKHMKIHTG
ncbi:zinc finger and SCAN domain-containing protein 31-like isoform X1 [Simochromis diagramma]|uniref:zinc finger and SCAN domain-containing protein 31-like isoform X1 n=1 Tax=Simochromis diagramma TaxID=43689 RepID=UPI001A7EA5F9|nr:zinc finger and SCAN domain-containing protein 31-like isoform X1 [Simochromis diagramma]